MITLERTPAPEALSEENVRDLNARAEAFFTNQRSSARRSSFEFGFGPSPDQLIVALAEMSHGRCCFCGRPDGPEVQFEPHRLRPPQDAVAADGRTSRRHYWWLAYEWENLYLACAACRTAQGSKFPTAKRRARVGTRSELNRREEPLLVDPADADPEMDPENLLVYLDSGEVTWTNERGMITIETFDLNRVDLVEQRRERTERTKAEIKDAAEMYAGERPYEFVDAFVDLYSRDAPFAALRRQHFNQWVQARPRRIESILQQVTGEEVTLEGVAGSLPRVTGRMKANLSRQLGPTESRALDHAAIEEIAAVGEVQELRESLPRIREGVSREFFPDLREIAPVYEESREIQRVEIHNFQGIDSLELHMAAGSGEGNWLMLLGENGAGKTAALKSIALTLMSDEDRKRVLASSAPMLRHGENEGAVRVDLAGSRNFRELQFGGGEGEHQATGSQAPSLLAAYGATRLLPDERVKWDDEEPRTGSLFDPRFALVHPAEWLSSLERDEFDAVASGLRTILQLGDNEEIRRDSQFGFTIESERGRFSLTNLSDGYRTMAILALDMMNLFLPRWGRLESAEGIVLIDEIGAHLHPRWQMKVVKTMRDTFPRVQFVATTHDPLCLRGLGEGEVVVLRRLDGRLIAQQDGLPSVDGLTVDQLLTNEHFGLFSTLDPGMEDTFERYYELLAAPRLSQAEEEDLAAYRTILEQAQQLGRTRRERLALEAVDEHLADERNARSADELRQIPEAARTSVRRLLEEAI
jgi:energy-coupling factor transporter ATP-binding protein EcfA2